MEMVSNFFTGVPIDWIVLAGLIFVLTIDSLRSGMGRAASLAIAFPLAAILFSLIGSAAFIGNLGFIDSVTGAAVAFGALVIVAYVFGRRMGIDYMDSGIGQPVQSFLAAVAATAIIVLVWLGLPELHDLWFPEAQLQAIFADAYRLWWLLGAFAILIFARG